MASVRRQKFETQVVMTMTLNSIAGAAGRVSTQVNNNDASLATAGKNVDLVKVHVHMRGGTTPTAGKTWEWYLVRGDNAGTPHIDGNLGAVDAAVSDATLRDQCELVSSMPLQNTTGKDYYWSFYLYNPGSMWSLLFWNADTVTTDATSGNFYVRYEAVDDNLI